MEKASEATKFLFERQAGNCRLGDVLPSQFSLFTPITEKEASLESGIFQVQFWTEPIFDLQVLN